MHCPRLEIWLNGRCKWPNLWKKPWTTSSHHFQRHSTWWTSSKLLCEDFLQERQYWESKMQCPPLQLWWAQKVKTLMPWEKSATLEALLWQARDQRDRHVSVIHHAIQHRKLRCATKGHSAFMQFLVLLVAFQESLVKNVEVCHPVGIHVFGSSCVGMPGKYIMIAACHFAGPQHLLVTERRKRHYSHYSNTKKKRHVDNPRHICDI